MNRHALTLSIVWLLLSFNNAYAADEGAAKVDFDKQIQPILTGHCAGCHGEKKALGKLRVHTAVAIAQKMAADKHLIIAGNPEKSELYERLVLPTDHKKRMPKKADPLAKEKIALIHLWIAQGAVLPTTATKTEPTTTGPSTTGEPAKGAKPAAAKPAKQAPLPEVAAATEESIKKLTEAGAQVMPLFAESPLLQVSFALGSKPATDAELALLAGVAPQTYTLNLAGSKMTDQGLAALSSLANLTQLHLENSSVTDAGLAHLSRLARLHYLNLYGTGITDAGLAHLKDLKHLGKLYLWNTKVSYDAARSLEKEIPGLQVNLGFNHPEVVRRRLASSVERLQKQLEKSKTSETQLQKQLEAARKDRESAQTLLEQTKQELAQLNSKTPDSKPEADKAKQAAAQKKMAAEKAAAVKAAAVAKAAAAKAAAIKAAAAEVGKAKAAAAAAKAKAAAADKAAAVAATKAADLNAATKKAKEAATKAADAAKAAAAKLTEAEKKAAEAKK